MIRYTMCASWFETLRAWLEILYFASAPVLAAGLIFAARQLAQSKKDMETRYKREAVIAALEACEMLRKFMVEALARNQVIFANPPLELREWKMGDLKLDWSSLADRPAAMKWVEALASHPQKLDAATSICNQMEIFALPFMKRVADEETAYESAGAIFCHQVEVLAPLFIGLRSHSLVVGTLKLPIPSGPFANTVQLYAIWASRAEKERLAASARDLGDRISRIEIPAVRPFGVE